MKKYSLLITFLSLFFCTSELFGGRIRQNFDFDWQFRLGEKGVYKDVQLPHDWSVSLDFDQKAGRHHL